MRGAWTRTGLYGSAATVHGPSRSLGTTQSTYRRGSEKHQRQARDRGAGRIPLSGGQPAQEHQGEATAACQVQVSLTPLHSFSTMAEHSFSAADQRTYGPRDDLAIRCR